MPVPSDAATLSPTIITRTAHACDKAAGVGGGGVAVDEVDDVTAGVVVAVVVGAVVIVTCTDASADAVEAVDVVSGTAMARAASAAMSPGSTTAGRGTC